MLEKTGLLTNKGAKGSGNVEHVGHVQGVSESFPLLEGRRMKRTEEIGDLDCLTGVRGGLRVWGKQAQGISLKGA